MGSLADETYDAIKAKILDHGIAPGEHVGIDELARELAVSQTPIREALARLESDGLVIKIPLRGYEATDLLSVQPFTTKASGISGSVVCKRYQAA